MDKINYLQKMTAGGRLFYDDIKVIYPLIQSLSPAEAVAFFDLSFEQHYQVRQQTTKKISEDMGEQFTDSHLELISNLAAQVNVKNFTKRETCGYVLMTLIANAATELQRKIIAVLLTSSYRCVRERAYKRLKEYWDNHFQQQVAANWERTGDQQCLKLIVIHFPADYLLEHFYQLRDSLSSYDMTGMFLKYRVEFKDWWLVLKEIDEVGYVYLLTKMGEKISVNDAKGFIADNYLSDRVGLLLWCFGKMKLWDALVYFNDHYRDKIWEHKLAGCHPVVLSAHLNE